MTDGEEFSNPFSVMPSKAEVRAGRERTSPEARGSRQKASESPGKSYYEQPVVKNTCHSPPVATASQHRSHRSSSEVKITWRSPPVVASIEPSQVDGNKNMKGVPISTASLLGATKSRVDSDQDDDDDDDLSELPLRAYHGNPPAISTPQNKTQNQNSHSQPASWDSYNSPATGGNGAHTNNHNATGPGMPGIRSRINNRPPTLEVHQHEGGDAEWQRLNSQFSVQGDDWTPTRVSVQQAKDARLVTKSKTQWDSNSPTSAVR
jgi:hypothetical protein